MVILSCCTDNAYVSSHHVWCFLISYMGVGLDTAFVLILRVVWCYV